MLDVHRRPAAQRSRAVYYSPTSQTPTVSVIDKTYSEMRDRPMGELMHDDFVNRNSTFEIDA
ncbi:unnamed protein product [Dibothriocephalus latus]|uniref:Uncharacterized protein n=1 Tax=Dibothriocephalus latus TaxID=60516 RepID=A0A3P7P3X0_DIBLA|nr:unnamed protein product [Dibothriocephalus latus]